MEDQDIHDGQEAGDEEVRADDGAETETEAQDGETEAEAEGKEPEAETEDDDSDSEGEKPKPKPKRPGKLERQIQRLEAQIERLSGGRQEQPKAPEPEVQPPDPSKYDLGQYDPAYLQDMVAHNVKAALQAERSAVTAKEKEAAQAAKTKAFMEAGRSKYDDFDEVAFDRSIMISDAMADAMTDSEMGADVAYWLGQRPKEAARIAGLSPVAAAREIGRIEGKLSNPKPSTKATTSAPPPPKRLKGSGGGAPVDPDKMSTEQWMKWRNEQAAKGR